MTQSAKISRGTGAVKLYFRITTQFNARSSISTRIWVAAMIDAQFL